MQRSSPGQMKAQRLLGEGDDTYQVISHVDKDVPVYVIKNKQGRRQTLHRNRLFLIS